ncbi:Hypothetical predicted protein, partial [Marmota monax]
AGPKGGSVRPGRWPARAVAMATRGANGPLGLRLPIHWRSQLRRNRTRARGPLSVSWGRAVGTPFYSGPVFGVVPDCPGSSTPFHLHPTLG